MNHPFKIQRRRLHPLHSQHNRDTSSTGNSLQGKQQSKVLLWLKIHEKLNKKKENYKSWVEESSPLSALGWTKVWWAMQKKGQVMTQHTRRSNMLSLRTSTPSWCWPCTNIFHVCKTKSRLQTTARHHPWRVHQTHSLVRANWCACSWKQTSLLYIRFTVYCSWTCVEINFSSYFMWSWFNSKTAQLPKWMGPNLRVHWLSYHITWQLITITSGGNSQ